MDENKVMDLKALKENGVMQMRDPDLFSIRLQVVGGRLSAAQIQAVGEAAAKYGRGEVHLTTRQGAEIPYVPFGNIEALRADLAVASLEFGRCGARVRTIVACLGMACRHGLIDAQALAQTLFTRANRYQSLPHKFKIAVTGCPNSCAKPQENDFGVMGLARKVFHPELCTACALCLKACRVKGALVQAIPLRKGESVTDDNRPVCVRGLCNDCGKCALACPTDAWEIVGAGYAVFVGGKVGRSPHPAWRLPFEITDEAVLLRMLDGVVDWYCGQGKPAERFGDTIERVGFDALVAHLE